MPATTNLRLPEFGLFFSPLQTRSGQLGLTLLFAIGMAVLLQAAPLYSLVRLERLAAFNLGRAGDSVLQLSGYEAMIEAKPVAGLAADLSSLSFNSQRRTLVGITNNNPQVVELSLTGDVIRRIPVRGAGDPEGIEWVGERRYVIADEKAQRLLLIEIPDDASGLDVTGAVQLHIPVGNTPNKGLEGLAYDAREDVIYVANERNPVQIVEVRGFAAPTLMTEAPTISTLPARDRAMFQRDLSGLHFDASTRQLLALSHESQAVVEIGPDGMPASRLLLRPGHHGLRAGVPQAEGLTIDDEGILYVVSEPNLFYAFRPLKPTFWDF